MTTCANRDVVTYAMRGRDAQGYGAMSTDAYRVNFSRYGAPYVGHLPRRLAAILDARFRAGAIAQVIYSYGTPIAWLDAGAWIVPAVNYSVTTAKHQGYLYRLPGRLDIPWDASEEEYMRVLNGIMRFERFAGTPRGVGRYVPAGSPAS